MSAMVLYRGQVCPEWVDYNGHMRDAYYLLVFSLASDALIDRIGLDDAARQSQRRSVYTLEVHLNYLREMKEGDPLRVEGRILASDHKRLQVFFSLHYGEEDAPAACSEQLLIHVDTGSGRSTAFDEDVLSRIGELSPPGAGFESPYVGRSIALKV